MVLHEGVFMQGKPSGILKSKSKKVILFLFSYWSKEEEEGQRAEGVEPPYVPIEMQMHPHWQWGKKVDVV